MSLATLLDKIAIRHRQRQQSRLSDYQELVRAIADGKEPDDERIAELLHDTDKSIEQLKHDVELYERRRQMRAKLDKAEKKSAEKPDLERQIEEHDKILADAQAKRDEDVTPFYTRLYEIKQAVRAGDEARQALVATCEDEELIAELNDVVGRLEAITLQRAETAKERDQLRRWADRNLHEAALTEWPHMKRNYQEDAEDQQERAQLLDDNLIEIERAIVRMEERERELREQLLVP